MPAPPITILLASASPRRREILGQLGIPILVTPVEVDESVLPGETPDAYLERVTLAKLTAATKIATASAAAILVADTSVIDGCVILGKPTSDDDAREMITRLAGKTHEVWTRFAIGAPMPSPRILHEETVRTRVTFRALSSPQVAAYVASGEGKDKAGAYAVQGRGAGIVSRIEGSYTNVVGLPACEVMVALERLGLGP
jgi:septum formation protein